MRKVWAVHSNWVLDAIESSSDVFLYSSYEAAKKSFEKLVSEIFIKKHLVED